MRRSVAVAAVALALAAVTAVPGTAAAAALTPSIVLSGLSASPGQARFLLTPRDLPAGVGVDPASVRVRAGQTELRAKAALASSTSGAPGRVLAVVLDANAATSPAFRAAATAAAAALAGSVAGDVQLSLFVVGDSTRQSLAPTTDRGAFTQAVSTVVYSGGLDPAEGVEAARKALAPTDSPGERRMLLFSDGRQAFAGSHNTQIGAAVASSGLRLEVVGLAAAGSGLTALTELATAAGGRMRNAGDSAAAVADWKDVGSAYPPILAVTVTVPSVLSGQTTDLTVDVAGTGGFTASGTLPATFATVAPVAQPSGSGLGWVPGWLAFVFAILLFLAVAAAVLALAWPRSQAQSRIRQIAHFGPGRATAPPKPRPELTAGPAAPPPPATPGARIARTALAASANVVRAGNLEERIALRLDQAGMRLRPHEWLLVRTLVTIGVGVLFGLLAGWVAALVGLLVGALATVAYQVALIDRRARAFTEQLPDGLQLVIGSLRSGFSLSQALESLVREGPQPVAAEFGRAVAEHRLGADISDALDRVAQRTGSEDLAWAVMAVRIQREVGGNLAEVLQTSVETMRERARLRRHVRALSAEGRISAWVLIFVPVALGLFMFVYRRSYLMPLFTDPRGLLLVAVGGALFILGIFWMTRVIKVEA